MAQPIRFPATVEQLCRHGPDIVTLHLRAHKRLPRFAPGQFIHLTVDAFDPAGFWPESRVFSVANAVSDRRTIEVTISRQGAYTGRIIDELDPGTEVWAKGPYGAFTVDASHGCKHAVLIAGGTGVTPFCALMDAALATGELPVSTVTLHYAARTPDLLIYRTLAERCAAEIPGFSANCYAEALPDGHEDAGIKPGRIDIDSVARQQVNVADTAFYLSGPRNMIRAFQSALLERHGVVPAHVLIDAWE